MGDALPDVPGWGHELLLSIEVLLSGSAQLAVLDLSLPPSSECVWLSCVGALAAVVRILDLVALDSLLRTAGVGLTMDFGPGPRLQVAQAGLGFRFSVDLEGMHQLLFLGIRVASSVLATYLLTVAGCVVLR